MPDLDPARGPDPFFFGYGSLVNRATHDFPETTPARVTGWRRAWRVSPIRNRCFLTVVPAPGAEIDGVIAAVPGADWGALDDRERGYHRHDVSAAVRHTNPRAQAIAIYAIPAEDHRAPGPQNPVALSYLDTVVAGFLREFGPEGVARFFDTTDGWQAPILDDRALPLYGRAQPISEQLREQVEAGLYRVGGRITRA